MKKEIEILIKRKDDKITLTIINRTDGRYAEYSDSQVSESKNIKECCNILLDGFSSAIEEVEKIASPTKKGK